MRVKFTRTQEILLHFSSSMSSSSYDPMTTSTTSSSSLEAPMMNDSIATTIGRPFKLSAPFDTSMALTILVLLTALFFMAFFSIYIRHFTTTDHPTTTSDSRSGPGSGSGSGSGERLGSRQKGMDSSTVQSLPLISYGGSAKHLIEDCPICLTEFEVSELVRVIPYCRHVFHQHCLDTWLSTHVTCPLCRSTQFFDDKVCLDVENLENGNSSVVVSERSTVVECDTCRNIRRSSSSSNLGSRVALHRSASF